MTAIHNFFARRGEEPMKILIFEDQIFSGQELEAEIRSIAGSIEIDNCRTVTDVANCSQEMIYDLAFIGIVDANRNERLQAIKILKENGTHNVILITDLSNREWLVNAYSQQPWHYITRPIRQSQLKAAIDTLHQTSATTPIAHGCLHEAAEFAHLALAKCQEGIGGESLSAARSTIIAKIDEALAILSRIRTSPSMVDFDCLVNHLCIAYYAAEVDQSPDLRNVAEAIYQTIKRLKHSLEIFLDSGGRLENVP